MNRRPWRPVNDRALSGEERLSGPHGAGERAGEFRLYAQMMRDECGAQDPRSMSVAITRHTSGLSLTAQQPVKNIVRGKIQAVALVLAGVQSKEISAFDEAYSHAEQDDGGRAGERVSPGAPR